MSYAKVYEEYWEGSKIEPLSDRAALLGLFLLTGPHRNAIGCFRLGIGAITDIPRFGAWGFEGVSKALQEMSDTGFIVRDPASGWTLITNSLRKDPINNPKAAIHAAALAERIPKNSTVYQSLVEILAPQLEAYAKALSGKPGYPMASPIEGASKPHTKPQRSQEQEQEQEQQQEPVEARTSAPPDPQPAERPREQATETRDDLLAVPEYLDRRRGTRLPEGWQPGPELLTWAAAECPAVDPVYETEKFTDYFRSQAGQKARKTDWDATWRNWIRRAAEGKNGNGGSSNKPASRASRSFTAATAAVAEILGQSGPLGADMAPVRDYG